MFILAVLSVFPRYEGLPESLQTSFDTLQPYIYQANIVFPIDTALDVATFIFGFYTILITWKIFNWIINKLRGSG